MKKNNIQKNGNSRQRFSIRKYSIGTVSVLAATFFIASGNVSFASESSSNELKNEQTSAKDESNRPISPSVTNENASSVTDVKSTDDQTKNLQAQPQDESQNTNQSQANNDSSNTSTKVESKSQQPPIKQENSTEDIKTEKFLNQTKTMIIKKRKKIAIK